MYRHTKLRLFDMAEEFELLLYLDCDLIALGRIEAVLDYFAPDGIAPQPLAVARDLINEHATFNSGVMALQPDHAFFDAMIAAGKAGVGGSDHMHGEQTFLNAFLNTRGKLPEDAEPQQYSWVELPPCSNVLSATLEWDREYFDELWPRALTLHWAGQNAMLKAAVRIGTCRLDRLCAVVNHTRTDMHCARPCLLQIAHIFAPLFAASCACWVHLSLP